MGPISFSAYSTRLLLFAVSSELARVERAGVRKSKALGFSPMIAAAKKLGT